jgi:hypothetical protein
MSNGFQASLPKGPRRTLGLAGMAVLSFTVWIVGAGACSRPKQEGTQPTVPRDPVYHELNTEEKAAVHEKLLLFARKNKQKKYQVTVSAEMGNAVRLRVGKDLGDLLQGAGLGFSPSENAKIGIYLDFPMTFRCSPRNAGDVKELISSLRGYIACAYTIKTDSTDPRLIRIYLNGTPLFDAKGRITFE